MPRRIAYSAKRRDQESHRLPATRTLVGLRRRLLGWFEKNGRKFPWRKASASNYQYIIAEVLLQRTRAETVADFFPKFIEEFPSWKKLGSVSVERLQRYLQPIGLWRRRATSIQALARVMANKNGRFPKNREAIEELPGIGQYIANAVLLFCHGEAQPLLDTNMARVLERVFGPRNLADIRYDPYLQKLALEFVQCKEARKLNWAILDLAATTCRKYRPHCDECPLMSKCQAARKRIK